MIAKPIANELMDLKKLTLQSFILGSRSAINFHSFKFAPKVLRQPSLDRFFLVAIKIWKCRVCELRKIAIMENLKTLKSVKIL